MRVLDRVVLDEAVWRARAAAHEARVDALVADHLERRRDGVPHPVHDFLFTYYSFRPAQLRRWHSGYGVVLAGREADAVTPADVAAKRPLVESIHALLAATSARPANFGCFGMHEWAMVYRQSPDEVRHSAWPLRLGPAGTDAVVESHRIACSHFDAFRFFTDGPAAQHPLPRRSRPARPSSSRRACMPAWTSTSAPSGCRPWSPSELVADCFELARDIRRSTCAPRPTTSPTSASTRSASRPPRASRSTPPRSVAFAERGAPLRARLVEACETLLAVPAQPAQG